MERHRSRVRFTPSNKYKQRRIFKVSAFLIVTASIYWFCTRSASPSDYCRNAPPSDDQTIIVTHQIRCLNKSLDYRIEQRNDYWVLYNYVPARRTFACDESVTYTTHTGFLYLDNLQPVLERWKGPISLALYAPGTDFEPTLASIRYLRSCSSPLIAEYVSFHVYFDKQYVPQMIPRPQDALNFTVDCTIPPVLPNSNETYQSRVELWYPINVGRNVARDGAQTHYLLASDIELYPSTGLVDDFLHMVRREKPEGLKVFVLPIFEVEEHLQAPYTKKELVSMLENGTAILFHNYTCPRCHRVPKMEEWIKAPVQPGMNVFHVARRRGIWEPIYIGTNAEPYYYDERLSWEGLREKMPQMYAMCVMDYEFHVLDNAFLVHRPGIKRRIRSHSSAQQETNSIIKQYMDPAYKLLYGTRDGCEMH